MWAYMRFPCPCLFQVLGWGVQEAYCDGNAGVVVSIWVVHVVQVLCLLPKT